MSYFTQKDFNDLWGDSKIVFDTSVLGLILQSNPKQSKIMMDLFIYMQDAIWIPAQVEKEFNEIRNNPRVTDGAAGRLGKFYTEIEQLLQKTKEGFTHISKEMLTEGHSELSTMVSDLDFNQLLYGFFSDFQNKQNKISHESSQFIGQGVCESFFKLIMKDVGQPFTEDELKGVIKEGEARYSSTPPIPPGYEDKKKAADKRYGDLIIWKQLLKHIGLDNGCYVFIVADKKSDWFELENNEIICSPRKELLSEAKTECPNAQITIVYFLDYIQASADHLLKNQDEVIQYFQQHTLLRTNIIQYIEDNLYELIEDEIIDNAADYNANVSPDVVEDIVVSQAYSEGEDLCKSICYDVEANCIFEYAINIHDSFDEPDDPCEIASGGCARVTLSIRIPIEDTQGTYDANHFIIDSDEWEITVGEINVEDLTGPFDNDDNDDNDDYDGVVDYEFDEVNGLDEDDESDEYCVTYEDYELNL